MRSIRLSLIVYFLLLQAVALGAVSALAGRYAHRSLADEAQVGRKLLEQQFNDRSRVASEQLDESLLKNARRVGELAQNNMSARRFQTIPTYALGTLTAGLAPAGHLSTAIYVAEATDRHPLNFNVVRRIGNDFQLPDELLPRDPNGDTDLFQVNCDWGPVWRSHALGDDALPFDADAAEKMSLFDARFDDVRMPDGRPGRRVLLKASVYRIIFRDRGPPPLSTPPPGPPPDEPRDRPGRRRPFGNFQPPSIVIHCAASTDARDKAISSLVHEKDHRVQAAAEQSEAELRALGKRMMFIGVSTFAATVLGGSLVIGFGLKPLRRLTDAVSRVSPRDFRLDAEPATLPRELRPIAGRLGETLQQLGRAFDREKQASADISHELRTPVAALLTLLDVSLRKPRSADEYRATLTECRAVGVQMKELVERLLALARLDAGIDTVRPQPFDVADLLAQCGTLIGPLAREAGLELRFHCPKPVAWTSDPDKVREVLVNLLHNAVEYNRPGGSIDVSAQAADGWLDLQVSDTGVGIPADRLAHIWERFYRADPSRQSAEMHAGLGLSIIRGYVDVLGGSVSVESRPGEGSTFRVRLPGL